MLQFSGPPILCDPPTCCFGPYNSADIPGKVVISHRGNCMFEEKVQH